MSHVKSMEKHSQVHSMTAINTCTSCATWTCFIRTLSCLLQSTAEGTPPAAVSPPLGGWVGELCLRWDPRHWQSLCTVSYTRRDTHTWSCGTWKGYVQWNPNTACKALSRSGTPSSLTHPFSSCKIMTFSPARLVCILNGFWKGKDGVYEVTIFYKYYNMALCLPKQCQKIVIMPKIKYLPKSMAIWQLAQWLLASGK